MRINSININHQICSQKQSISAKKSIYQSSFQGRHSTAKFLGGLCAGLGTLGALGGIAIMTGGVSLIPTLAYGAFCGGVGAAAGHIIDKDQPDYKKKK